MLLNALAFAFNAIISNVISWIAFIFVSAFFMLLGIVGLGLGYFILEMSVPVSERPLLIIGDTVTIWRAPGVGCNAFAIVIAFLILFYFFGCWLGFHRAYLRYHDTGEIKYRPVFDIRTVLSSMIAWALLLPLIVGGFILLILPGIIVVVRSFFTQYFIVDKNMGPVEAIKASWALTKDNYNQMIGLLLIIIVCGLIPIVGVYVVSLITVYVYRHLGMTKIHAA
jgi:uncharacterized membrane protein